MALSALALPAHEQRTFSGTLLSDEGHEATLGDSLTALYALDFAELSPGQTNGVIRGRLSRYLTIVLVRRRVLRVIAEAHPA
jgi:hypothetical protein